MWSVAGNDSLVALYSEHELQLQPLVACSTTTIFAKNMFLSEVYIVQWLYKVRETYLKVLLLSDQTFVKMVNGNYVLYGDRPSSESEIVDDHVHSRSNDRKNKRKMNRTANELQHTLNLAQLDNETDSVKYEKKIKEPRLLRYVPTTEVEENFVTEKFETYDLKPTEERPRRYAFTKKPKNPSDGSVNYAYSRSSSSCSSPNGNLPTISEHGEQYGTYRVRAMPSPTVNDLIAGYDTKLDKYFSKPRDVKPFSSKVGYNVSVVNMCLYSQ